MTRSSIYNYFQTKEEIFLALITREFQSWCSILKEIANHDSMTLMEFAETIASSLQERRYFLKLISWNWYYRYAILKYVNNIMMSAPYFYHCYISEFTCASPHVIEVSGICSKSHELSE